MKVSPIQLVLIAVSAITAAMIPSQKEVVLSTNWPINGVGVASSLGGLPDGSTVTAQIGGERSWTETGLSYVADDYLSATSKDDAGTLTNQAWFVDGSFHNATAGSTTSIENEWY